VIVIPADVPISHNHVSRIEACEWAKCFFLSICSAFSCYSWCKQACTCPCV